ncbi:MAG TPA: ATP-binding protein [Niabella sp.]|nr:ATP-binding protein [Niabella sp.]
MKHPITGRIAEVKILEQLLKSDQPELLAIYGRRRVGKTYLIKNYYADRLKFSCSGESGGSMRTQLANFQQQLNAWFPAYRQFQPPANWQQAFVMLRQCLDTLKTKEKKVLFFDELPWLDTHKSGFISAFGYFWNIYLSERPDMLVVICGSAASWMIKKVVNNKGGLHNRITQRIQLLPFSLKETKDYLQYRKIRFSDHQVLQLYMVTGGIPHYLNAVKRGQSLHQAIDNACFTPNGLLAGEFQNLYAALFSHYEKHVHVIEVLAKKNKGLTRNELLASGNLMTGGGLTAVLEELTESGFVEKTEPFNKKKKESLYRLVDEFSLFYLRFMRGKGSGKDWLTISKTAKYVSWCGYAFENVCMKHILQIKKALGISGIGVSYGSWYRAGNKMTDGAQIDLLLDRSDDTIHICEIKFSTKQFIIDKRYSQLLQQKIAAFRESLPPGKGLLLAFITTYGVADNEYRQQFVDNEIGMESLFDQA